VRSEELPEQLAAALTGWDDGLGGQGSGELPSGGLPLGHRDVPACERSSDAVREFGLTARCADTESSGEHRQLIAQPVPAAEFRLGDCGDEFGSRLHATSVAAAADTGGRATTGSSKAGADHLAAIGDECPRVFPPQSE
jgi:hypothetical protein